MKKFLVGVLLASAFVVTVPVASDVVEDVFTAQTEEVAYAEASFRVRTVDPEDPGL